MSTRKTGAEKKKEILARALTRRQSTARSLSYGQEALWFDEQRTSGSPVYNISVALRILSPVDVPALGQAIELLVNRHDQLRTHFPTIAGVPYPVTDRNVVNVFQTIVLDESDEDEPGARANQDAQKPFNLEQGPLVRVRLYSYAETDHILLLVVHHMVADGWSLWLILDELQAIYTAEVQGAGIKIGVPQATFGEFVAWQRKMVEEDKWREHQAFWRDQFAVERPPLDLPTDSPRPVTLSFRGAVERFELEAGLVQQLNQLSRDGGITPAALLMAAFQVLLFRLTQQENFVVGLPSMGRGLTRFTDIVGYFVNPLPIQAKLQGKMSFYDLMCQVYQRIQKALVHQDYPFPLIVRDLQLERDPAFPPLFESAFVYHKPQRQEMQFSDSLGENNLFQWGVWDVIPYELDRATSIYYLSLQVMVRGDALSAEIEYSTDLFDKETVQSMASYFQRLLEGIVAKPDQAVGRLPLLSKELRRKILYDWNQTNAERPPNKCIHHLFEEQVSRTPRAAAVVYQGVSWSYQQLNNRANQLAHFLYDNGVRPGDIIGVHLPRSVEYLSTILAIIKSGAAFLPLEVTLPRERLAFMVADSKARAVINEDNSLKENLGPDLNIIKLHESAQQIAAHLATNLTTEVSAEYPAYVIYTSGTTGLPKGVLAAHKSVTNMLYDLRYRMEVRPSDVWLSHITIAFDASMVELFLPLCVGASIHIISHEDVIDGYRLVKVLEESGASLIISTPSFWNLVLSSGWKGKHGLRAICGGDRVLRSLADQLMDKGVKLHSGYGPTETTVACTAMEVRTGSETIPIGRVMENNQVYILDEEMQPVPVGVPGELYVGGNAVSIGYINRFGLTAGRFVPDPFGKTPGARLYRTGDRAHYNRDKTIEFLGRVDDQVKIRGFRVEPGEIENRLNRHDKVLTSVVMTREREPGDLQLVAYVQPEEGQEITGTELGKHLRKSLPAYMLPASIGIYKSLPLLSSGKVDRHAVPSLPLEDTSVKDEFLAPRTELESLLARLVAEVLELQEVGIDDNFFELGGHSLLAMRLLALIQAETDQQLAMSDFLILPTVRHLASLLSDTGARFGEDNTSIPRLASDELGSLTPLTQGQIALWYVDQLEPENATYNLPSSWRIKGLLDQVALEKALISLVARHDVLRSCIFLEPDPVWKLGSPELLRLEKVDLSHLDGERRSRVLSETVKQIALRPFDLLSEIPFRASIIALESEDHVLVLVGHHIALDGWSSGIIVDELGQFYTAEVQGQVIDLPALELRFGDYAIWQQELIESGRLDKEAAYWKEKLTDLPTLELGGRQKRTLTPKREAGLVQIPLPADLVKALEQWGRQQKSSLFTTLMAAFQLLIYRHTYQTEFGLGFPVTGRNRPELGHMIGYVVNMLVLRAKIDDSLTFEELLKQVRRDVIEALSNQNIPFEKVVEVVQPHRTAGQNPLFQVLFTIEMELSAVLNLDMAEVTEIREVHPPAQFDLVMSINQQLDGMSVDVTFDREKFDLNEIQLMTHRFVNLLQSLADDPTRPIKRTKLMPDQELQKIQIDWNKTEREYPRLACIHKLLETQADRDPGARAVSSEEKTWNYEKLNARANQLARHLRDRGIKPGDIVAVELPRTAEFITAILAVFKTGGVYMPLDHNLPTARLLFMVADSGAVGVLSDRNEPWSQPEHVSILCNIEKDAEQIANYSTDNLTCPISPDDPASVIYTSGSSGQPKGVLVSHQSVVNVLVDKRNRLKVVPSDIMLSHLNVSFDASIAEILMPLSAGASLYLASKEISVDPYSLIDALERSHATLMHATPDMWRVLLESDQWDGTRLKVFCGGQKLHRPVADEVINRGVYLVNAYGPTEATIMSTTQLVVEGEEDVSIGRPISNVRIYILDHNMRSVPVGVPGEMFIGGESLAFGYINRAGLTAEHFVPDPFSGKLGSRLYRSGDFARYRPDGSIDFIGRKDRQVKIRGFRIELGEIENRLHYHEKIDQVTVEAMYAVESDLRLVAYVVMKMGMTTNSQEMKAYLERDLPAYMVPSTFVSLEQLPLTANGKVDRVALPEPVWGERPVSHPRIAPRNPTEIKLVAIWSDLLHAPEISVADDFFDLGGHSLLVIQMMNRIETEFGHRLPLASFAKDPTIKNLSGKLLEGRIATQYQTLVPLRENGADRPLFLVTAGYNDFLTLNNLAFHMKQDRPVYLLQPPWDGSRLRLEQSLDGLLAAYIKAIRNIQPAEPYLLAGFCSGGLMAFALAQRLFALGGEVDQLILMDTPASYPRSQHAIHRILRWFLSRVLRSENHGIPRRTAISGPLFSDAGLVIHLNALSGYRATEYPGRITLIFAEDSNNQPGTSGKDWQETTSANLTSITVPGDHNSFASGMRAAAIAAELDGMLQEHPLPTKD